MYKSYKRHNTYKMLGKNVSEVLISPFKTYHVNKEKL